MFSLSLKNLREENGFSQQTFAKKIGVSQSTVGMWESGKREPNFTTIKKLADFFNVSVDVLLGREPLKEVTRTPDDNTSEPEALTEKEKQLIQDYRSLSNQGKEYILQTMDMAKGVYKKDTDVSGVEIVG